ncbi:hypothetical protein OSH03_15875 [Enterobacter sp. E-TC7]|uniref:Uncharacterized protein n=1 Tax=Enterobacter nematophilus TaxID=2994648 RepID=A0ABT3W070_9ENTR|nr:hypothetical protein [Enterobacter nematophilus]MCX5575431.1 hypothetical protein [Enterobacter nematophilus]
MSKTAVALAMLSVFSTASVYASDYSRMMNVENPDRLKLTINNATYEEGYSNDFIPHLYVGSEDNGVMNIVVDNGIVLNESIENGLNCNYAMIVSKDNGVNLQANGKNCSYKKKNYRSINSPVVTIINDSSLNLRPNFSINGNDFFADNYSINPNGIRMFTGDSGTWKKQGVRHGDNLKVKFSYTLEESGAQKEVVCPSLDSLTENRLYRLQGGEQNALCVLESNDIHIKNDRIVAGWYKPLTKAELLQRIEATAADDDVIIDMPDDKYMALYTQPGEYKIPLKAGDAKATITLVVIKGTIPIAQ